MSELTFIEPSVLGHPVFYVIANGLLVRCTWNDFRKYNTRYSIRVDSNCYTIFMGSFFHKRIPFKSSTDRICIDDFLKSTLTDE